MKFLCLKMIQIILVFIFLHTTNSLIRDNGKANYVDDEEINYLYITSMMDLMRNRSSISDSEKFFSFSDFEVNFFLLSSEPHTYEELITGNISSVTNSSFDFSKETKVLVHGWLSSAFSDFSFEMASALLQNKNCNVITVEWPSITIYIVARKRVDKVARELSRFLDFLVDEVKVNASTVHVLGHSLGAHVAGLAGGQMKSTKLPRITGLDPAGPLFSDDPKERLDRSQAEFVDVIHTGGNLIGFFHPIGDVDFYPNGGTPIQPGCGLDFGICTHIRSYQYYIGSLYEPEPSYIAAKCENYLDFQNSKCCDLIINMGEYVDNRAKGKFFLYTKESLPYGLGKKGISEQCWHETNEPSIS